MKTDLRARALASKLLPWTAVALLGVCIGGSWLVFLSGGLGSIVGWAALQLAVPVIAVLTLLVTVAVAVIRRRGGHVVAATAALFLLAAWPAAWLFQALTIPFPYSLRTASPAATVRLPLDGPVRVLWGGDDVAHNHHASFPDQRWAYDLGVEPVLSGSAKLEDYGCWGKDVVAPIAGEVWVAHDGEPDQVPGKLVPNYAAPFGNHVVLRLQSGTFVVVAHLQKGSVVARQGERVGEGDALGRCGDSGNTSEPHVHIHHQRQDPRVNPVNFAEGLPLYFRDHDGPAMPPGGIAVSGGKARPTGAIVRHVGPGHVARAN